jgi:hypothetical protein
MFSGGMGSGKADMALQEDEKPYPKTASNYIQEDQTLKDYQKKMLAF